jgi:hypothetical protein
LAPRAHLIDGGFATSSGKEIRILIADDHPVVREGIMAILALQKDLKVVGQARDGDEA